MFKLHKMGRENFVLGLRIITNFICPCTGPLRATAKPYYLQRSEEGDIWTKITCFYGPNWFIIHPSFTRKQFSSRLFNFVGGISFSELWDHCWCGDQALLFAPHSPPAPPPPTVFDVVLLFLLSCPVLVGAMLLLGRTAGSVQPPPAVSPQQRCSRK